MTLTLRDALRLAPGEVVAFTGGGGKTAAMFRLAGELVAAGQRVITTTTTRIFAAQTRLAPAHAVVGPGALTASDRATILAALDTHGHVLVTGPVEATSDKSFGVDLGVVEALRALPGQPTILAEADGSRMRPFKAPAEHEPVIADATTLVVPVAGADVLGAPLGPQHVHRPELVQALTGAALGEPITPELVAAVLAHPAGGLKAVPPAARVIPLINKVETSESLEAARALARHLLAHDRIEAVVLGAVRRPMPVAEVWGRAAAVVLAAGRSTRMGQSKQLLPWGATSMLGAVVRQLGASDASEVMVVTGAERAAVEAEVRAVAAGCLAPVDSVENSEYATSEMARSLQVGLAALRPRTWAALVVLADQPHLEAVVVAALIQRWRETQASVLAPYYGGQRGHPLLFDCRVWPELHALPHDANPRQFLQRYVSEGGSIEWVTAASDSVLRDLDTPEDYRREVGIM